MKTIKLKDYPAFLEKANKCIRKVVANSSIVGANLQVGLSKKRIFNDGLGSDNNLITNKKVAQILAEDGIYSKGYSRKRKNRGKQIKKVDLEFDGDLRRSIQVGTYRKNIAVGYVSEEEAKIMEYNEDYRKKAIAGPSVSEIKQVKDRITSYIAKEVINCIEKT